MKKKRDHVPPSPYVDVITLDGPAGAGKGTVRHLVATKLGFHQLDSGILYRAVALEVMSQGVLRNESAWEHIAQTLNVTVDGEKVFLDGRDVSYNIRSEDVSQTASLVSAHGPVRHRLKHFQLSRRQLPGLVADGRDQGYIFDTMHRFFLTAAPEIRATRRVKQLNEAGRPAQYEVILESIIQRDHADKTRLINPLRPHPRAQIIDTSKISAQEVAEQVLYYYHNPF